MRLLKSNEILYSIYSNNFLLDDELHLYETSTKKKISIKDEVEVVEKLLYSIGEKPDNLTVPRLLEVQINSRLKSGQYTLIDKSEMIEWE